MPNTVATPAFPTAIDDGISLLTAEDNASATVASTVSLGATTITLTTGHGANLAAAGAVVFADNGEIVYYGSNSGDVLGDFLAPVAGAHNAGVLVKDFVVAQHHNGLVDAIAATQTKLGTGASTPGGSGQALLSDSAGVATWRAIAAADVGASGSNKQIQFNNGGAFGGATGFEYDAAANWTVKLSPAAGKTGASVYEPASTAPATIAGAPSLLHLHTINASTYWALGYTTAASSGQWANYMAGSALVFAASDNGTGSVQAMGFSIRPNTTESGYYDFHPKGVGFYSASATYFGGIAEVASDQFGLMLTTGTPTSGAQFPLTWRATGITQLAPATALADGSVPINHLHFYLNEAADSLKAKWKESGGTVFDRTLAILDAAQTFTGVQTFTAPVLGTPTSVTLTNATGLPPVTGIVGWPANSAGVLTNNGSGGLSWGASGGSPGGSDTELQFNNGGAFDGISGATTNGTDVTFGSGNLLATLPEITGGINDSNGNSLIALTATASAVYGLTLANAALAGTVAIGATAPTAGTNAVKGAGISIIAPNSVAGSAAGSIDGSTVLIQAGNAARNASGNPVGGDIGLGYGTNSGAGSGRVGGVFIGPSSVLTTFPNFFFNSTGQNIVSTLPIRWSSGSSAAPSSTFDLGIVRSAAGVLDVHNATAIGTTPGNARDLRHRAGYFIEATADPSAANLTIAGSNAKDVFAIYMKSDKFVIAYNDSGTVTYISIPLDGATTTWSHSTSAP